MTVMRPVAAAPALDVARVRRDFPILAQPVHGKRLVYLDSAASAQKPRAVIEAERLVYETKYANIHRGVYELSEAATGDLDADQLFYLQARGIDAAAARALLTRAFIGHLVDGVADAAVQAHVRSRVDAWLQEMKP